MPGTALRAWTPCKPDESILRLNELDHGLSASRDSFISLNLLLIEHSGQNGNNNYLQALESDIEQEGKKTLERYEP